MEIVTHMMPFYSYDVPHTCGPVSIVPAIHALSLYFTLASHTHTQKRARELRTQPPCDEIHNFQPSSNDLDRADLHFLSDHGYRTK